ncbi:BQ5605_C021g09267 [Microbotryum silenes-dioicae]|uniref:BQ5605_C021g09267 protein n=1 Tax=Microbotryum silenes-dioicae TaxID=796604 RepID=A0A2X0MND8_9BASI|nr:BQ5605_C021g09267 [Microbotryum silenes-dioicae]
MVKYLWVSTTTKRSADEKQELISWLATQSSCGLGEQIKGEFYIQVDVNETVLVVVAVRDDPSACDKDLDLRLILYEGRHIH